jgi:S-DNA-T family DNA segregation ATPase FtsK/SpoIIIE
MSTKPIDGQQNVPALRAVPTDPAELAEGEAAPAAYADVTAPGERKPILPPWLASADAAKHHGRRAGGYAWHAARYHGLRSPLYLALTVFWAAAGVLALVVQWVRWVLFPVPLEVYTDAIADGHRAWHRTHAVHEENTRQRLIASAVLAAMGVLAWAVLRHRVPGLVWPVLGAAAVVLLARLGRGSRRIVQPAHAPWRTRR